MEHNNNQPSQPYSGTLPLLLFYFLLRPSTLPPSLPPPLHPHTTCITAVGNNKEHMCPSCVPVSSVLQMSWHPCASTFYNAALWFLLLPPFSQTDTRSCLATLELSDQCSVLDRIISGSPAMERFARHWSPGHQLQGGQASYPD
jgi:hypothetical protein